MAVLSLLLGLCVGSFLNVVIIRTREGRSFVSGRSECPACHTVLAPRDLVPLVSFALLRGACRTCRHPISWQYPLVEASTGLLFFFAYVRDGLTGTLLRDLLCLAFLALVFVYDVRYGEIPDRFSIPGIVGIAILNLWLGADPRSLALGAVVIGGFFLAQRVISRGRWVGGGDIRMGALMGAALGLWEGLGALFAAYLIGAVWAGWLLATKRAGLKTAIPFGTFLSVATAIFLFFGPSIIGWYVGLMR